MNGVGSNVKINYYKHFIIFSGAWVRKIRISRIEKNVGVLYPYLTQLVLKFCF